MPPVTNHLTVPGPLHDFLAAAIRSPTASPALAGCLPSPAAALGREAREDLLAEIWFMSGGTSPYAAAAERFVRFTSQLSDLREIPETCLAGLCHYALRGEADEASGFSLAELLDAAGAAGPLRSRWHRERLLLGWCLLERRTEETGVTADRLFHSPSRQLLTALRGYRKSAGIKPKDRGRFEEIDRLFSKTLLATWKEKTELPEIDPAWIHLLSETFSRRLRFLEIDRGLVYSDSIIGETASRLAWDLQDLFEMTGDDLSWTKSYVGGLIRLGPADMVALIKEIRRLFSAVDNGANAAKTVFSSAIDSPDPWQRAMELVQNWYDAWRSAGEALKRNPRSGDVARTIACASLIAEHPWKYAETLAKGWLTAFETVSGLMGPGGRSARIAREIAQETYRAQDPVQASLDALRRWFEAHHEARQILGDRPGAEQLLISIASESFVARDPRKEAGQSAKRWLARRTDGSDADAPDNTATPADEQPEKVPGNLPLLLEALGRSPLGNAISYAMSGGGESEIREILDELAEGVQTAADAEAVVDRLSALYLQSAETTRDGSRSVQELMAEKGGSGDSSRRRDFMIIQGENAGHRGSFALVSREIIQTAPHFARPGEMIDWIQAHKRSIDRLAPEPPGRYSFLAVARALNRAEKFDTDPRPFLRAARALDDGRASFYRPAQTPPRPSGSPAISRER